jgi:glycosyltransferase involved in cell wall biosynthesis
MHILFFSHYYPPEVNAPASRTSEHCRAWVKLGYRATVVTCAPNHPTGKIYPGYRNRIMRRENIDGVEVIRIWTLLAANQGFFFRTLNYVSYFISAVLLMPTFPRPDIIVSTSPQFFCGLAGLAAGVLKRRPCILEIRDIWPESIVAVGAMKKGVAIRFLEWLEAFAYRRADAVVVVTRSFVAHIAERCGEPGKIAIIRNGADLQTFRKMADGSDMKAKYGLSGKFVAAYVGTHGMAHGLDTILDAAELVRDDPRIAFLMVGDGSERMRLVAERDRRGIANVHILGQLPKADMPAVWGATDVSLILLRRQEMFTKVLPSKLPEAMAMQCPVILGVEGEARDVLTQAGAGIPITPEDAGELAGAVRQLADDPELAAHLGEAGLRHVRAEFDRAVLAQRFVEVLKAVIARRPLPPDVAGAEEFTL